MTHITHLLPSGSFSFDFDETASYKLHDELPGQKKQDAEIPFTEPQVLVVYGKAATTYTGNESAAEATRAPAPRQATVADKKNAMAVEEDNFHVVGVGESLIDASGAHEMQTTPTSTPEEHQSGGKAGTGHVRGAWATLPALFTLVTRRCECRPGVPPGRCIEHHGAQGG